MDPHWSRVGINNLLKKEAKGFLNLQVCKPYTIISNRQLVNIKNMQITIFLNTMSFMLMKLKRSQQQRNKKNLNRRLLFRTSSSRLLIVLRRNNNVLLLTIKVAVELTQLLQTLTLIITNTLDLTDMEASKNNSRCPLHPFLYTVALSPSLRSTAIRASIQEMVPVCRTAMVQTIRELLIFTLLTTLSKRERAKHKTVLF